MEIGAHDLFQKLLLTNLEKGVGRRKATGVVALRHSGQTRIVSSVGNLSFMAAPGGG